MPTPKLPDVHYGQVSNESVELEEDRTPDDDEEMPETPADIISLLGFDPLEE